MTSSLIVVKYGRDYNKYGELESCGIYEVTFYKNCVEHYPNTDKVDIDAIGVAGAKFEGTREREIAWIELCGACCDADIQEGYFAYLNNKYWKIVGIRVYDDCGCKIIKLTLERLEPRETHKELIECVDCYEQIDLEESC